MKRGTASALLGAARQLTGHALTPLHAQMRRAVGAVLDRGQGQGPGINFDAPAGDPGLFGPDSVVWRIHGDFPGMMAGGICALMLQTLHPLALAGVWDHSNFRQDLLGRLRRTTAFVAGTSYASTGEAQRLIAHVAAIHRRVRGTSPDGRRYAADQPRLLTWVHITEMTSFLAGYERYRGVTVPPPLADRYYAETATVAEALGARRVPRSRAAVERYFERVRGELEFGERSIAVLQVLADVRLPVPGERLLRELFLGAGAALLPPWAAAMMRRSPVQAARARAAAAALSTMAPALRAALREGVAARACRRVGIGPEVLEQWPELPGKGRRRARRSVA
jgi:uncharacterized protein (DUF2236 family)